MPTSFQTQRVTAVDLKAGRIRVPHDTKALLPSTRDTVSIVLRGEPMVVAYDPRNGQHLIRPNPVNDGSAD